jgi:hypothetical protein
LTSQILMNGALQKLVATVEKMGETMGESFKKIETAMAVVTAKQDRFAEGMISLELKMEETTGKLNALIDTVDGIIRKKAE